jgi:lysophospholipid acyltransferase (LPLAT)-like uncharacterized protein
MQPKNKKKPLLRWYDPILLNTLVPIFTFLLKLLLMSCRQVKFEGLSRERETIQKARNVIYCTWHQRIAYCADFMTTRNLVVMVSQSRDGEYATRLAKLLNVETTRGSSTRGGKQALDDTVQGLKEGKNGAMLVDGPVGPARVAKIGTVIMAYRAGVPIIPVAWGAERCWVLNSWDRFMIPKPFSRVVVCMGEPIWIPENATTEKLEKYRELLQERLNDTCRWCDEQFGEERPWRRVKRQGIPERGPLAD